MQKHTTCVTRSTTLIEEHQLGKFPHMNMVAGQKNEGKVDENVSQLRHTRIKVCGAAPCWAMHLCWRSRSRVFCLRKLSCTMLRPDLMVANAFPLCPIALFLMASKPECDYLHSWSAWIKRSTLKSSGEQFLFCGSSNGNTNTEIKLQNDNMNGGNPPF